jgi:hypothetical protein
MELTSVPGWRPKQRRVDEWRAYRANTAGIIGWRERHALTPSGIELRNPFNDLRIVELMASATAATKRFDGRSKSVLRAAEAAVVPRAVADRQDFGVIGELVVEPLWREEPERFAEGVSRVAELPFLHAERVRNRAAMWLDAPNQRERDLTWRLITCGLWLSRTCAADPEMVPPGPSAPAKPMVRKGVRTFDSLTQKLP